MSDRIPKILHVYWGGGTLPYLRYLTIESFRFYNPDWDIYLWMPEVPTPENTWTTHENKAEVVCDDWLDRAEEISDVVETIDFSQFDLSNDMSEVHKSDFWRWYLLANIGGIWADMDILFIRPIVIPQDVSVVYCKGDYGHSIGFMMGDGENYLYSYIFDHAKISYNPNEYQCIGSILLNSIPYYLWDRQTTHNLPMDVVYPYDANHVAELYSDKFPQRITDNTIGIHWYAGHPLSAQYLNETNGALEFKNCLMGQLVMNYLVERDNKPFNNIYTERKWGSDESNSGTGSDIGHTVELREQLPIIWEKYNIKRLLDIGCGDFNWMREITGRLDYYCGVDVVPELIEENNKNFGDLRHIFLCRETKDLTWQFFQNFDAVIIKDVLVHLSLADCMFISSQMRLGGIRFLFATNFVGWSENTDIKTGDWRPINMMLPPFSYNAPIETIVSYSDNYYLDGKHLFDKTLGMWVIDTIASDKHNHFVDGLVRDEIERIKPINVVDVGTGDGYWGKVLKLFGCNVVGVELSSKWFDHCNSMGIYDNMINDDIHNAINGLSGDLIIFGDILEHLERDRALETLYKAVEQFKYVIVNAPVGFVPQESEDEEEIHRCGLTKDDFTPYEVVEYNEGTNSEEEYVVFNCLIHGRG